ncbi:MAG TPA: phosphotransferase [Candidatus Acidoferrales bacterium]|nr:phosphotransferase [Candidatus Acidoferrales bacterium]
MGVKISPADALALLRANGHDVDALEPLTGGMWSTTFAFNEKGREYVVRFHERRDDLEKDRFAARWSSPRLRTVRMTEIGDVGTGAYGISERIRGAEIDGLDAEGMRRILPQLFDTLEATRDADLGGTSGWGLWHGDGNAADATWAEALMRNTGDDRRRPVARSRVGADGFDAGVRRMRELLPFAPERRHLVHNDLLYHNVFVDDRGIVLLDWGASIYGDFLYDAALLTFWWPWYAQWSSVDIVTEVTRRFGTTRHFAERLRLCELDIGVSHIAFQLAHRDVDSARWTSRRTAERANAPL